jgi:hypothetical protein
MDKKYSYLLKWIVMDKADSYYDEFRETINFTWYISNPNIRLRVGWDINIDYILIDLSTDKILEEKRGFLVALAEVTRKRRDI